MKKPHYTALFFKLPVVKKFHKGICRTWLDQILVIRW